VLFLFHVLCVFLSLRWFRPDDGETHHDRSLMVFHFCGAWDFNYSIFMHGLYFCIRKHLEHYLGFYLYFTFCCAATELMKLWDIMCY
jgi:hypothetical protein